MPFGQKKRLFRSMNIKKHTFSFIESTYKKCLREE